MKKLILTLMAASIALGPVSAAKAGDREWATAGKILAGAVGVSMLANAMDSGPRYYSDAPVVYGPPAPVYAPPPQPVYYESTYYGSSPAYATTTTSYYGDAYRPYHHRPYYSRYEETVREPVVYERRTVTRAY